MHTITPSMSSSLTTQPTLPLGAVGALSLNYDALRCLDMAIYSLSEQLASDQRHPYFKLLCDHHVQHLSDWLNQPSLRKALRFDNKNSVTWPVISLDDAQWLRLALRVGLTEDTVMAMALDDANYEQDMAMMDANYHFIGDASSTNAVYRHHYRAFYDYYAHIARSKTALLAQLTVILED